MCVHAHTQAARWPLPLPASGFPATTAAPPPAPAPPPPAPPPAPPAPPPPPPRPAPPPPPPAAPFYVDDSLAEFGAGGVATSVQHNGKEMSYNNYLDADAAYVACCDFKV